MKKLAIVIPAYKVDFFETVLFSLAQQTCKDFTVYIGEDCSRDDFKSILVGMISLHNGTVVYN